MLRRNYKGKWTESNLNLTFIAQLCGLSRYKTKKRLELLIKDLERNISLQDLGKLVQEVRNENEVNSNTELELMLDRKLNIN